MRYKHTQIGYLIIAVLIAVIIPVLVSAFYVREQAALIVFVSVFALAIVGVLFSSLTVEIFQTYLKVSFGLGIISKKIVLSNIESVEAVRTKWYYGWGIKYVLGEGWMWNVSGFDAVRLKLKDGTIFRIGTDEPQALEQALKSAIQK